MQQKLALAAEKALGGSHQVMITFKEDAASRMIVRGIFYLFGMLEVGQILFSEEEQTMLRIFLRTRKWARAGGNHPMLVTFTSKFKASWFVDTMHHALERIEVVTDSKIEIVVSDALNTTNDKQIEATTN